MNKVICRSGGGTISRFALSGRKEAWCRPGPGAFLGWLAVGRTQPRLTQPGLTQPGLSRPGLSRSPLTESSLQRGENSFVCAALFALLWCVSVRRHKHGLFRHTGANVCRNPTCACKRKHGQLMKRLYICACGKAAAAASRCPTESAPESQRME